MVLGYARVSTFDQNTAGQLPELKAAGCKRIYEEKMSGRTMDRPELERCLERLEADDTLVIWRLDRLGRSLRGLLELVAELEARSINFVSLREKFDTSTASGRLIFHVFASLTQYEREMSRERTMAGLAAARERGSVGGRHKALSPQQVRVAKTLWKGRELSKVEIAKQLGVSVSTIHRVVGVRSGCD